jgi:hypothetical protein
MAVDRIRRAHEGGRSKLLPAFAACAPSLARKKKRRSDAAFLVCS